MYKSVMKITALLYLIGQSGFAETVTRAQDYAVDSDVVLESAVKEVKSIPEDTVNIIGDVVKDTYDEVETAAKGVASIWKPDLVEKQEKAAAIETAGAWDTSDKIVFRSYKVSESVGEELLAGKEVPEGTAVDISDVFHGIDFPKGSSVYYRPEFKRVFIRQTLSNIYLIEDVLAELHSVERDLMGKQVLVETKFIEVNQSTLNELGFRWNFAEKGTRDINSDGIGDAKVTGGLWVPGGQDIFNQGLRTAATALSGGLSPSDFMVAQRATGSLRWDLVIRALEQDNDTDVLSAPSIVTRDGSTANILVGEERTVSVGFDVKSSESSLYIEHDLESDLMGVMLEVTPEIRSDLLIDLELSPKVVDLIGYDNYTVVPSGSTIEACVLDNNLLNYPSVNMALQSRMPYYRLREMETQLTVADGSTVGMGGLIYDKLETFKDKVPVLGSIPLIGRLFRSEGENSVKRNLMIFVTATQVDVNGRKASDLALKQ